MVLKSQVTFGSPVGLSGYSVGMAGGAVSPLWSLPTSCQQHPISHKSRCARGQGFHPLLKLSPWCPNGAQHMGGAHSGSTGKHSQRVLPPQLRTPAAVAPSVSLKGTGLPGSKLPMIRNGCLTKGSPFWRNSLSNACTAVSSRTLAPRLACREV